MFILFLILRQAVRPVSTVVISALITWKWPLRCSRSPILVPIEHSYATSY